MTKYAQQNAGVSTSLLVGLTLTAALSIANLCYFQPMAELLQTDFGTTKFIANLATTLTQAGYTLGILFLVPTGDMFNRKKLMLVIYGFLLIGLIATALAPTITVVLGACLLVGVRVCAAQILVPMVSLLSKPENKSRNIGYMVSGILIGMLMSRVLSGFIGERWGWRTMFWIATAIIICCTLFVMWWMPNVAPTYKGAYKNLLLSILQLIRNEHDVVICAVRSGLVFGTENFWTYTHTHVESYYNLLVKYIGFNDLGHLFAGGCGDTNGRPQIKNTNHLQEAFEFG